MENIIKLSTTVVCVNKTDNNILMTVRHGIDNVFNLPCGIIGSGENPHTVACREFERSTNFNLDYSQVFLAGFTNLRSEIDPFEYITMVFACSNEAIISNKSDAINHGSVDGIRWMTIEDIESKKMLHRNEFVLVQTYMGVQFIRTKEKSAPFFRAVIAT